MRSRRAPARLLTLATVGLVLVIVVVLVVIKVVGTPATTPNGTAPLAQPLPAAVAQEVTGIPGRIYDAVGIDSPTVAVTAPKALSHQPALRFGGKPGFLYVGAEFSPYSGAERWAIVAALARFGRFSDLQTMQSSSSAVYPNTQSLAFYGAQYTSRYLSARLVERYSNQRDGSGTSWSALATLSPQEEVIVHRYDVARYTGTTGPAGSAIPFVNVANKVVSGGAGFSPSILQGLTRNQIAAGLTDAKNPVTQAIVASANYLSAAVCSADGAQPTKVCSSRGVTRAARALGLS